VDGNDVVAVYQATREAVTTMRNGSGPHFLECRTYRWHKHFLSNALHDMRPAEEVDAWKERCPVSTFEAALLKKRALTKASQEAIKIRILVQVEAAVQYAVESPYPQLGAALEDVYSSERK
jgi:TPP-dependent pyruvate/acetoin dehydrogenase alpha subunit